MSDAVLPSLGIVAYLALFAAVGIIFLLANLVLGWFVRPNNPHDEKLEIYECGEETIGDAWIRFGVNYYIYALLFLAFEVDVLYLLPVSVVYNGLGLDGFFKVFVFLFVLFLAIVFFWAKGVFTWPRRINY